MRSHDRIFLTLGRPGGGGGVPPPGVFSPVTFLMIPIAKIASSYLLHDEKLGNEKRWMAFVDPEKVSDI